MWKCVWQVLTRLCDTLARLWCGHTAELGGSICSQAAGCSLGAANWSDLRFFGSALWWLLNIAEILPFSRPSCVLPLFPHSIPASSHCELGGFCMSYLWAEAPVQIFNPPAQPWPLSSNQPGVPLGIPAGPTAPSPPSPCSGHGCSEPEQCQAWAPGSTQRSGSCPPVFCS